MLSKISEIISQVILALGSISIVGKLTSVEKDGFFLLSSLGFLVGTGVGVGLTAVPGFGVVLGVGAVPVVV